ncbi:hypothetical protein DFH07DRAFT_793988 [Mycena maculata]|uniref:Uncharacterized protein n=1 Tax=Mycena maculata TaxID=230809 RepID=A0AAD7NYH9_9AGAR|nr:hypothetical protein DFH07DRAFT_793988 [Mycena maculata]
MLHHLLLLSIIQRRIRRLLRIWWAGLVVIVGVDGFCLAVGVSARRGLAEELGVWYRGLEGGDCGRRAGLGVGIWLGLWRRLGLGLGRGRGVLVLERGGGAFRIRGRRHRLHVGKVVCGGRRLICAGVHGPVREDCFRRPGFVLLLQLLH